ncbi:class I SAM-dependent methyltransferase [Blastococcus tunisiensis]|uniref:Cyclopropane-fatty-acyl-phospholipid synthase n=1 Tax=Blastococcus tunisiensis TaxID=1798228 RepID=A0A1I1Y847_9ACTN|nr:class I SAM-dependent methyltransferase [Blastococcus sp. DSM 46838]SFE14040.1 cyclopropane-fatty-acyl-phospholipid synthase [Blastococcus sp. DSM 46838]
MAETRTVAERLTAALAPILGVDRLPVRLRAWDGSVAGPSEAPLVVLRSPQALRRLVWARDELGLARAYVAGEIDVECDLYAPFAALTARGRLAPGESPAPSLGDRLQLVRTGLELGVLGREPPPPPEEIRVRRYGRRHSRGRDAAAVSAHYDVGNDFYRLVLGPSLVYSCAVWDDPAVGLEAAQEAKLDLVCRKLALRPGSRLLDVGCGWGSLALHAAREYGATVVGITVSQEQAALARKRVAEEGLPDAVEIRVQDYRAVDDGPFDAISSIGMAEHVGRAQLPAYAATLGSLLRPGGRLLNHAISWVGESTGPNDRTFIARYVFPDGELVDLADMIGALTSGGLEVIDVEPLRQHYALTLRAWVRNLEEHWDDAVAAAGAGRARVWRLYMVASALAFEVGKLGVNQVLLHRPGGAPPPLRPDWLRAGK